MAMTAAPMTLGATATGLHGGAFRPPAVGLRGVVSSAHGLASQAGVRALMLGGNAVDAAVAVAATLAVVEPFMSGLGGGGGYMLIRDGKSGQVHGLNYYGKAPRAARGDVQPLLFLLVRADARPGLGRSGRWRPGRRLDRPAAQPPGRVAATGVAPVECTRS